MPRRASLGSARSRARGSYRGLVTSTDCLLVVGSNPPSQTSGARTLGRVDLARQVLGFERAHLVNLFALPSYRSDGLSKLGSTPEGWLAARDMIEDGLESAGAVLLAYGTQMPSGAARQHHRDQVAWLGDRITERAVPTWWVGGAPRHPSRWHRYTWREFVGIEFGDALRQSLSQRSG